MLIYIIVVVSKSFNSLIIIFTYYKKKINLKIKKYKNKLERMKNILYIFFTMISSIFATTTLNKYQNNEYRNQYIDYCKRFEKEISEYGFNNFLESLSLVQNGNKERENCRFYLTQYSDTEQENRIFKKCNNN